MECEHFKHISHITSLVTPSIELAITISAGAAFAEAIVAIGIDLASRVQELEISSPGLNRLTPIYDHAGDASASQLIGTKQPCRTVAYDHHATNARHRPRMRQA